MYLFLGMMYKSPSIGHEVSAVFHGVDTSLLKDNKRLQQILIDVLKADEFTILGETHFDFKPQGFTILVMLAESHASVHTYPEYNSLYFQVYSCRGPKDGKRVFDLFKEKINPKKVAFKERAITVGK